MIIQLTQGNFAEVDEIDSNLASTKWQAWRYGKQTNPVWYASRTECAGGMPCKKIYMHRIVLSRILGRDLSRYEQVDHINHDGLDNRRINLRLSTHKQNHRNIRIPGMMKSSCFKGVSWSKQHDRWRAQIKIDGRTIHLGLFTYEVDAAKAYDSAAKMAFQNFCCLNFKQIDSKDFGLVGVVRP